MGNEQPDPNKDPNNKDPNKDPNKDFWTRIKEQFQQLIPNRRARFSLLYFAVILATLFAVNYMMAQSRQREIPYSRFKQLVDQGAFKAVRMESQMYYATPAPEGSLEQGVIYKTVPVDDPDIVSMMDEKGITYQAVPEGNNYIMMFVLNALLPIALLVVVWRFIFKRMSGGMGSGVMKFGQNKSQIVAENSTQTRFADVAGADESKAELEEVVDFLKKPDRYRDIGGKIPKGVLLVGPPGTGKTLLARAVAGEAEVTFFRMSGADFVEMFVGVGASRVRDLFKQAREKAPCIVFIDELDAVGKNRAAGLSSNDEREQTLNQLLVEMDGFDPTSGVILLAATNRPEVLDPALLRPGRFDRQIMVDRPDLKGREAILRIHAADVKLEDSVDLVKVAQATPGMVGSDLANIINEAALLAVRDGRQKVRQGDFDEAIEKTVAGLEKRSRLINDKERRIVAYHETGHALVAAHTEGADPVQKISIVPRGMGALGYTLQMPSEDRFLMTRPELIGRVDVMLGGRAAEELIFGEISTGAANDISRATDVVRRMITEYGMSGRFENVTLNRQGGGSGGQGMYPPGMQQREYSESTQQYVDEEISRLIAERYQAVKELLQNRKESLESVAQTLLKQEILSREEFLRMIGLEKQLDQGSQKEGEDSSETEPS